MKSARLSPLEKRFWRFRFHVRFLRKRFRRFHRSGFRFRFGFRDHPVCLSPKDGESRGSEQRVCRVSMLRSWQGAARSMVEKEITKGAKRVWSRAAYSLVVSGLQKGPAERGHVKKLQKVSKIVFGTSQHVSRRAKNVKNRQKSFSTLFDNSRAEHQFSGPFWGGSAVMLSDGTRTGFKLRRP